MADEDFIALADWTLGEIKASLPDYDRAIADAISYDVLYEAETGHKDATGTPHDWLLLGMYVPEPTPHITIFEQPIRKVAHKYTDLHAAIYDVLGHEIYQHGFGLDHTKETMQQGLIPAYAVDGEGNEHNQWLHPLACNCQE